MIVRALRWIVAVAIFGWLGRLIALPRFWIFGILTLVAAFYVSWNADPTLFRERLRPSGETIDRSALLGIRLLALATMAIAIPDIARVHWSDSVPEPARISAMGALAASLALIARTMVVNRFFSSAIRLQTDRDQVVVSAGPYAFVRHPGYLGMLIALPAAALALGSWLALPFATGYSLLIARRAAVEDRFLHAQLPGYAGYARRVRFRLIPRIW